MHSFLKSTGRLWRCALLVLIPALLLSCAGLEALLAPPQEPSARIDRVDITGLSFEDVELTALVTVENPNGFGVELSGYDYTLDVADGTPLSGSSSDGLSIAADASSSFEVPFRVGYADLFDTVAALRDQNETDYRVALTPYFDVPVLGEVAFDLSKEGTLPILRLPRVRFAGIELADLSMTSADLTVAIEIENDNATDINLHSLPYRFELDGRRLVSGDMDAGGSVPAGETRRRTIRASIGVMEAGTSVWNALTRGRRLPYRFEGELTFGIDLPLVEPVTIPFSFAGEDW
ncbi:MAG: LEA type 2 family protein [Spirochaetia bacterium]